LNLKYGDLEKEVEDDFRWIDVVEKKSRRV